MKKGKLSDYFKGVAVKVLSRVETDPGTSNQHEFNGVGLLQVILGDPLGAKKKFDSQFMYLNDADEDKIVEEGFLTWYDARYKHPTRSEARLYYSRNRVIEKAKSGDVLFLAKCRNDSLLCIVTEENSSVAAQLLWLFGIEIPNEGKFQISSELDQDSLLLTTDLILENIGISIEFSDESYLNILIEKFPSGFPSSKEFSEFSKNSLKLNTFDNEDQKLLALIEREELLFRTLEKHIIGKRLEQGFSGDVDKFISYSLSVQNRRKSRAGHALENHVESIIKDCKIKYARNCQTENKSKPDFIFPGNDEYHNPDFDFKLLTMLGVKSTCKDRWRQVLSEAARIPKKHLLTLQVAISKNQTDEMNANNLQLVVPKPLHVTFSSDQQDWLMTFEEFLDIVKNKQSSI